ncbi:carbohydrate sulfotransferase 10 isoform X2 [Seriola lalandi dorsalis]|uniref:Carbohydrate sulfotransferase n=2 Tax=Seriola TaxID=8160 RepID=A0A3B4VKK2_SERDU|nr:carbohydrate sulfotransferase 10 [Seriola dumerili]XP_022624116.1 carbohydrate sulfotransferase 10 [Seriola dumerili]XP_023249047.1 carbohydrate sulfotransferase 10 isoform X2 [Seriola lalandi dorsalis]XP_056226454.1 carbohydrate sulfotransferase 10 [Seriola aureovittata]XP_056226455.1 carbohydrate sulfotransferase 10 [Seriola aureovittata]
MCEAMRHHWLLLGACGWVLLILMFVSKFISFRAVDDYGERVGGQSWTVPGAKVVKTIPVSSPEKPVPKPSDQPSAVPTVADWQSVADKRIELLSTVCKNSSLRNLTHVSISKFVLDRIFVCDKHKILFCQTPKVGNTQWKKVLIVLNGAFSTVEEIPENLVHDHEKNGLPRLSSLTPQEITYRLSTYFKFFIVRDPFERLISAFKDKFVKNPRFEPWYKHDIAPAIIRKYRKSHRDSTLAASGLHFEDFVRYLGDVEGRRRMDRQFGEHIIHWVTYAELCAPCEIHYSVVGHHETLEQDAPHILKAAGIDQLVSYPSIPPGITRYNRTKVEHYFSGISKRDIRRLYARYQGDFHLFGYPSPDFLLN